MEKSKILGLVKSFHTLKNFGAMLWNREFSAFKKYEHGRVAFTEINDLDKLKYVRNLDLAKSGYIGQELKEQIELLKRENRLFQKDLTITPFGKISIHEPEGILRTFRLGHNPKNGKTYISRKKVANCPVWYPFQRKRFLKRALQTRPIKSDYLYLKNHFFDKDIAHMTLQTQKKLRYSFNVVLQDLYHQSPHLKRGVQNIHLMENGISNLCRERPIKLKDGPKGLYVPKHIGKNYVVLAPYLEASGNGNVQYLSLKEFQAMVMGKAVALFAQTKYGVDLGLCGELLHIRAVDTKYAETEIGKWMPLDRFLDAKSVPAKMKYEVAHFIIEKKDFLTHVAKIPLGANNAQLSIKKHFGSGEHYYALEYPNRKVPLSNFKPVAHLEKHHPIWFQSYRDRLKLDVTENPKKYINSKHPFRLS